MVENEKKKKNLLKIIRCAASLDFSSYHQLPTGPFNYSKLKLYQT